MTKAERSLRVKQGIARAKLRKSGITSTDQTVSQRIEFPGGGKRDDGGRSFAFHLMCPAAINAYALVCKEGEVKYGPRNWEKGIPTENYIDHALQHVVAAMQVPAPSQSTGDKDLDAFGDKVEGLTHRLLELSHALWNIAAAIHNESECKHHDWKD